MNYAKAFFAGFVATLIFHQGVYTLLYLLDSSLAPPFNMTPTPPLGIPAVLSLAFWGGVWGLPVWWLIRHAAGAAYWLRAAIIGAIGPSAVAMLIVFPLKGLAVTPKVIVGALILNAAWGLGVALCMRLAAQPRR